MRNPAVDAYVAKSADFAQPILRHVRTLMHRGCPRIEETIKWGVPAFERDGIVAMMAAFKHHVAFGFWSEKLIRDKLGAEAERVFPKDAKLGMAGRRYHRRAELPCDTAILRAVKVAVALNESGERPKRAVRRKPPPKAPPDLAGALRKDAKARATWARLTPGQQRESVDWLVEAKRAETRARRLGETLSLLAAGKTRYWKYQDC
jgi:uncharacterized protein YdeI (YjbR/CyaY-like superfamily)